MMKCPSCGKEGAKYIDRKDVSVKVNKTTRTLSKKTSNKARCGKCGWEGVI